MNCQRSRSLSGHNSMSQERRTDGWRITQTDGHTDRQGGRWSVRDMMQSIVKNREVLRKEWSGRMEDR